MRTCKDKRSSWDLIEFSNGIKSREKSTVILYTSEHFMAKWIDAEKNKAGLRHAVVCPNVTGRTKERIAQSKRARAGSLALID